MAKSGTRGLERGLEVERGTMMLEILIEQNYFFSSLVGDREIFGSKKADIIRNRMLKCFHIFSTPFPYDSLNEKNRKFGSLKTIN